MDSLIGLTTNGRQRKVTVEALKVALYLVPISLPKTDVIHSQS